MKSNVYFGPGSVGFIQLYTPFCLYSLLCLREGEAEGEGTEVRGTGMGHLRTGSSTILLLSISSIMYSTEASGDKEARLGIHPRQERNVGVKQDLSG